MITHLDLFSGIGGFAYAVDRVWQVAEHIFCDNDEFCRQVLKKHWPDSKIYGDIKRITKNRIIADAGSEKPGGLSHIPRKKGVKDWKCDLLTGGFPCQPFSQAGERKGTEDDRYLWPEMLRLIRSIHPRWVIGENVGGFVTWNGGMVFGQVCADLEKAGYEVQAFIIPACAVNAPHRRDRIWIVAHRTSDRRTGGREAVKIEKGLQQEPGNARELERGFKRPSEWTDNQKERSEAWSESERCSWNEDWLEVATEFCGVDDGLPVELDGFKLTKAGHRVQRLKALGNAIVPQVAIQIMQAIKQVDGESAANEYLEEIL